MNNKSAGYGLAVLGVLGIITGAAFYAEKYHKTIGMGGIVLGVIFIILGAWYARKSAASTAPKAMEQAQRPTS